MRVPKTEPKSKPKSFDEDVEALCRALDGEGGDDPSPKLEHFRGDCRFKLGPPVSPGELRVPPELPITYESRGIHHKTYIQWTATGPGEDSYPARAQFEVLLNKARTVLEAAGHHELSRSWVTMRSNSPVDELAIIASQARDIEQENGLLSEVGMAARFISRAIAISHHLREAPYPVWDSVLEFCEAFYWLRMEAFGEHALAFHGAKSAAARAGADVARSESKQARLDIVSRICEAEWESYPSYSAQRVAKRCLDKVNEELKLAGHRTYAETSLIKAVQSLARERDR